MTGANGFVGQQMITELSRLHNVKKLSFSTYASEDIQVVDTVIHLAALVHQMKGSPEAEYLTNASLENSLIRLLVSKLNRRVFC